MLSALSVFQCSNREDFASVVMRHATDGHLLYIQNMPGTLRRAVLKHMRVNVDELADDAKTLLANLRIDDPDRAIAMEWLTELLQSGLRTKRLLGMLNKLQK